MKIENVRMGFATNSSSTHSLVFFNHIKGPKGKVLAALGGAGADGDVREGGQYGWDGFICMSPEAKRSYVAQMLYANLLSEVGPAIAETVAREWSGGEVDRDGYIDHQSLIDLPRGWDGHGVDKEFFEEIRDYFTQDNIAILGGNDNDSDTTPHVAGEGESVMFRSILPVDEHSPYVARRDGPGGYWTLFNRENGTKIRVRFQQGEALSLHRQSSAPELVDVKITDFCPFGCSFCYQDSTLKGAHADDGWVNRLAISLGDMRVFEVAIGGGEPTMHPKFLDILEVFKRQGIVPNFTTKNLAWLHDRETADRVKAVGGAFAYSVEKESEIDKLERAITVAGFPKERVRVQHVLGIQDYGLRSLLERCKKSGFAVTLLGYKAVGRGKKRPVSTGELDSWVDTIKEMDKKYELPNLGVDTAIIKEYEAELKAAGVRSVLYTKHEGQFSCYVDAVKKTLHASSYDQSRGEALGDLGYGKVNPPDPILTAYRRIAPPDLAA